MSLRNLDNSVGIATRILAVRSRNRSSLPGPIVSYPISRGINHPGRESNNFPLSSASRLRSKALDLNSGGNWFKSRPDYRLS
jgi:hypothetical protein